MDSDRNITVEDICEAIGRRLIADSIGVGLTSVSNAIVDGRFPARWFHVMDRLCTAASLPCPRRLFTFVGADAPAHHPVETQTESSNDQSQNHDAA